MSGTVSHWETTAWRGRWDLIIVGAGITGCATALRYFEHKPDAKVLLLERHVYPSGASTRNAGFTCFGTIGESLDDLAHETEDVVFARIRQRYEGMKLLLDTLPAEEIEHRSTGGHELFLDVSDYRKSADAIPWFNERLADITGIPHVYAGTRMKHHHAISIVGEGHVHSGKLLQALHKRVRERGGEIRWNMAVKDVETGAVRLVTGDILHADRIVLATNGFSGDIPGMPLIHPARGVVLIVDGDGARDWRGTWHFDRGFVYFRDAGDALLIGGGRNLDISGERTTVDAVNPRIRQYLLDFVSDTLGVKNAHVRSEWSGVMGFPEGSKTPVIEEVKPGVWVAAGLGGMGVALGMGVGRDGVKRIINGQF
jgi:glycine/D-amino acid oxidase-like deaminating enzyme